MSEVDLLELSTPATDRDPELPRLLGGLLCLDFVNTVEDRTGESPLDLIADYDRLVRWGWHAGLIDAGLSQRLHETGTRRPELARLAHASAIALRESIYRVVGQVVRGEAPEECDLDAIAEARAAALAQARLRFDGDRATWYWPDEPVHLDRVVWPVARSAVALVTGPDLKRVKQCPGPTGGCGWLFLDTSKNQSRRWCSMDGCGSQAKMRRRHGRSRGVDAAASLERALPGIG